MKKILLVSIVTAAAGCALPPDCTHQQSFVPQAQLVGVDLAREGLGLLSARRYADAEERFLQPLYLYPNADNLRVNLAAAYEGSQLYPEAIKILSALVKKNPQNIDYNAGLGRVLFSA